MPSLAEWPNVNKNGNCKLKLRSKTGSKLLPPTLENYRKMKSLFLEFRQLNSHYFIGFDFSFLFQKEFIDPGNDQKPFFQRFNQFFGCGFERLHQIIYFTG